MKKVKKALALLLALALCASLAIGCGSTGASSSAATSSAASTSSTASTADAVKVGLVFPVTGSSASPGQMNIWGITDYFDMVNERGGIQSLGGAKLEAVIKDSEGAADIAVTAAENLIGDDSISALMGTYNSGTMSAVQPVAVKYNMPMMGVNSVGSYCYTTANECVAHVVNLDQQDLGYMIKFYSWMKEKGVKSVFLVMDNSELSTNNQVLMTNTMKGADMPIADTQVFNVGASDFSTIVQKIKDSDAGLVIAQMGVNDAILFTQTLNEYGVTLPVQGMGTGFSDPTYLAAVGDLAEGLLCSSYWFPSAVGSATDPELAKSIVKKCEDTHGVTANEPYAIGWTAAATLVDAIERAGSTDRAAIAKAIMETDIPADGEANLFFNYGEIKFETITFDNGDTCYNQNPNTNVMYAQYLNGNYEVIWPDANATAEIKLG